jgi:transposase-like protein
MDRRERQLLQTASERLPRSRAERGVDTSWTQLEASVTREWAYCASCKKRQPVLLIRGHNGARDHYRCHGCLRTWPTGKARHA